MVSPYRLLDTDVRYVLLLSVDGDRWCLFPSYAAGRASARAGERSGAGTGTGPRDGCVVAARAFLFPASGNGGNALSRFVSSGDGCSTGSGDVWLRSGVNGDLRPGEDVTERPSMLLDGVGRSGFRNGRSDGNAMVNDGASGTRVMIRRLTRSGRINSRRRTQPTRFQSRIRQGK